MQRLKLCSMRWLSLRVMRTWRGRWTLTNLLEPSTCVVSIDREGLGDSGGKKTQRQGERGDFRSGAVCLRKNSRG
jgi:hypothetical protein